MPSVLLDLTRVELAGLERNNARGFYFRRPAGKRLVHTRRCKRSANRRSFCCTAERAGRFIGPRLDRDDRFGREFPVDDSVGQPISALIVAVVGPVLFCLAKCFVDLAHLSSLSGCFCNGSVEFVGKPPACVAETMKGCGSRSRSLATA